MTKLGGNTSGISALVLIARRSECATHSANLSKILLINSRLKLGKKSAKSQAMERNGPAERENGLFRREQFPSLSRKRPRSLALKPNVCKLGQGVGKPTGAAVGTGFQPSLGAVRRVSPGGSFSSAEQGRYLGRLVRGCLAYHAVPPTRRRSRPSCTTSPGTGSGRWGAGALQPKGARDLDTDGANRRSVAAARQGPAPVSAATLHRQTPEVGAECVSSARSDLSGGRPVTGVPCTLPTARRVMISAGQQGGR